MWFFLTFIPIACFISLIIAKKRATLPPAAMAVVMAIGILTKGVLPHLLKDHPSFIFFVSITATLCCGLWLSFLIFYVVQTMRKSFRILIKENAAEQFSIGTWVAGTSICSLLISQYKPLVGFSDLIFYLNCALWLFYILISGKTWFELIKHKRWVKLHGIILLTTVSTESLVVLVNNLYNNVPAALNDGLVLVGLCFYAFSLLFLILRYAPSTQWTLEDDWNNTNCIIHGALSITGLSMTLSHSFSPLAVASLWIIVGSLFILIEGIEILRFIRRVKRDGLEKGVLTYHLSQWSRLFTFGMFFTFTSMTQFVSPVLSALRHYVLIVGGWIVVGLVLLEVILWLRAFISSSSQKVILSKGETLN